MLSVVEVRVIQTHCLGIMNVCATLNHNPSKFLLKTKKQLLKYFSVGLNSRPTLPPAESHHSHYIAKNVK